MLGICRRGALLALILLVALALGLGCRKELPELFDRNQAPETILTAAPVESLFDGFQVQLNWYGRDPDGEIAYFLWAWTDSSRAYFSAWNPESRAQDRVLQEGLFDATHLTTRTDSLFFIQTNDGGGTARDVTFNITAVDDQGKRDPIPARLYFFGSVDKRPQIVWLQEPPDTLDAGESFSARFTGTTENGYILGYQWSAGEDPLFEPRNANGDPIWTYQIVEGCENLSPEGQQDYPAGYCGVQDSTAITLFFANDIAGEDSDMIDFYKFGTFLVKATCQDLAGVESEVNTNPDNLKGVLAPVLNRDPDTRLRPWDGADDFPAIVRYKENSEDPYITYGLNVARVDTLPDGSPAPPGFHYALEDTLPWGEDAWVRFLWQGWDYDSPIVAYDEQLDLPAGNPLDLDTIQTRFQMDYTWKTLSLLNSYPLSANSDGRYPAGGEGGLPEDLGLSFTGYGQAGADFEMNLAVPANYIVRGYAQDFFERVDGSPATVTLVGGFAAQVDSIVLGSSDAPVTLNLTELADGDPVRIDLAFWPQTWDPAQLGPYFEWDAGTRTATIHPFVTDPVSNPGTIWNEFDISMTVYGHDDARNGIAAQLGRFQWDMIDTDFGNSSFQFVPNFFEVTDGSTVKFWKPVFPGDTEPPAEGAYTVHLWVRERVVFPPEEPPATPDYLGPKAFAAKFCNSIESQTVESKIEDQVQQTINLNNIGRASLPLGAEIDIQYKPFGS